jgi:hypothetical protein
LDNKEEWRALLNHYEAAVAAFEQLSDLLRAALAHYPPTPEICELIAAEERARTQVTLSRARLMQHWRDSLDDTLPLRVLRLDHSCDRNGPTQRVLDRTGPEPLTSIYPTCSICGTPQVQRRTSADG